MSVTFKDSSVISVPQHVPLWFRGKGVEKDTKCFVGTNGEKWIHLPPSFKGKIPINGVTCNHPGCGITIDLCEFNAHFTESVDSIFFFCSEEHAGTFSFTITMDVPLITDKVEVSNILYGTKLDDILDIVCSKYNLKTALVTITDAYKIVMKIPDKVIVPAVKVDNLKEWKALQQSNGLMIYCLTGDLYAGYFKLPEKLKVPISDMFKQGKNHYWVSFIKHTSVIEQPLLFFSTIQEFYVDVMSLCPPKLVIDKFNTNNLYYMDGKLVFSPGAVIFSISSEWKTINKSVIRALFSKFCDEYRDKIENSVTLQAQCAEINLKFKETQSILNDIHEYVSLLNEKYQRRFMELLNLKGDEFELSIETNEQLESVQRAFDVIRAEVNEIHVDFENFLKTLSPDTLADAQKIMGGETTRDLDVIEELKSKSKKPTNRDELRELAKQTYANTENAIQELQNELRRSSKRLVMSDYIENTDISKYELSKYFKPNLEEESSDSDSSV